MNDSLKLSKLAVINDGLPHEWFPQAVDSWACPVWWPPLAGCLLWGNTLWADPVPAKSTHKPVHTMSLTLCVFHYQHQSIYTRQSARERFVFSKRIIERIYYVYIVCAEQVPAPPPPFPPPLVCVCARTSACVSDCYRCYCKRSGLPPCVEDGCYTNPFIVEDGCRTNPRCVEDGCHTNPL